MGRWEGSRGLGDIMEQVGGLQGTGRQFGTGGRVAGDFEAVRS